MGRLAGKVAIVTGSASGAGKVIAARLLSEGAKVCVADIDLEGARGTVSEFDEPEAALALHVDVRDEAAVAAMVASTVAAFGRLDVLCNNATDTSYERRDVGVVDLEASVWDEILSVNLRGVMFGCKHALPAMIDSGGGSIVNISSIGALRAHDARFAAYSSAKAGILGLTRCTAAMYGPQGVRCNAIAPGFMYNPETADRLLPDHLAIQPFTRMLPYSATPDDVGAVVAFFASDDSKAITGQTWVVDVGATLLHPSVYVRRALSHRGQ
jgi:NAD(P)-dependent dehydrogenase (short-subunit alcohol dehydrogenase family)